MYRQGTPIRLIGMRVDGLEEKQSAQISLFDNKENEKQDKLDKVVDNSDDCSEFWEVTNDDELAKLNRYWRD